jgi:hypothetical protein
MAPQLPLEVASAPKLDDDGHPQRTGTLSVAEICSICLVHRREFRHAGK